MSSVDHTGIRVIPPVYMVTLLIAGFYLNYVSPWRIGEGAILSIAGWVLLSCSLALLLWTMATMKKSGSNVDARKAATLLLSHGPFKYSRNPIYLSSVFLFPSLGLINNSVWLALAGIVLFFILIGKILPREEAHMTLKFGDAYREYCKSTRRWL